MLRRRLRLYLGAGAAVFLIAAAAVLILRRPPEPYTPGAELERGAEITRSLDRELPSDAPAVRFADATAESGLRFVHFQGKRSTQLPEDMGSGLAWGDYDGDGDPDLFLVNAAGPLTGDAERSESPARSTLYRNEGDGTLADVGAAAGLDVGGWGMAAAWGDYDGDRDLDLAVTRYGTNRLFRNEGDGTFVDVSDETGIGGPEGFWTGASWGDFDRDGDVDLYVCGYVRYQYEKGDAGRATLQFESVVPFTLNPSSYPALPNLLYRNDGGRFREVAREAGVANPEGRSLSASWADFDADGWPDLYVANDVSDNAMFHNRGDGRFDDVSHAAWVADYRGAMGLAIGDWNDDGHLDIFVTHWLAQENALFENQAAVVAARPGEPMHFVDKADLFGLGQIALDDVGWGTEFVDYDNDGRLDLFVANGSTFQEARDTSRLVAMRNRLFWNGGPERGFFAVGAAAGEPFTRAEVGRGAAFADYDDDGDLDAAVLNNGGPALLLRNEGGEGNNWLRVVLRGPHRPDGGPARAPATSTFALGARVRVTAQGITRLRTIGGSSSYLSQPPPGEAWFGLGRAAAVDRLEIDWPDGTVTAPEALPVNAAVRIVAGEPPAFTLARRPERGRDDVLAFWERYREATAARLRGDCGSAESIYQAALRLDPEHEDTLYYLGQCRMEIGRTGPALEALQRLVALRPESPRGHVAIAVLHASIGGDGSFDLEAAERHLRRAHALNREETGPLVRLGEVRLLRGDAAEAGSLLRDALRTNPKSVEAAFLLGYLAWDGGDSEAARDYCRSARQAARREAPAGGVPGEGDVRRESGGPAPAPVARPALLSPLARELLAHDGPVEGSAPSDEDLRRLYEPVREFLAGRAGR
jgi:Flp pilus assembly protein TadD